MKMHFLEMEPEGSSSQRLSLDFYSPADWDEALQVTTCKHTKAKWPIGVYNVYHCVLYLAFVWMCCVGNKPQATNTHCWAGKTEPLTNARLLVQGGKHPQHP